MEAGHLNSDETEAYYYPTWFRTPRGFEDRRAIEAEIFNDILTKHVQRSIQTWTCDDQGWKFEAAEFTVIVNSDGAGHLRVHAVSDVMPRRYLDPMRAMLPEILFAQDELSWNPGDFVITLLQLVEEAEAWSQLWQQPRQRRTALERHAESRFSSPILKDLRTYNNNSVSGRRGFDARSLCSYGSVMNSPYGVNPRTVKDTAIEILGTPIEKICDGIKGQYRILHIESVFRDDLVQGFKIKREQIFQDLLSISHSDLRKCVSTTTIRRGSLDDTQEGLAEELAKPRVTFHGAPRHCIESIVRYGFAIPGRDIGTSGQKLRQSHGSTFGNGVYSSPDSTYASHFIQYQAGTQTTLQRPCDVPSVRLIVCATLMGLPILVNGGEARDVNDLLETHCHSHVSGNELEYIVFDTAQIIPVYVLHLDYGAEYAKAEYAKLAGDPIDYLRRRRKEKPLSSHDEDWNQWYNSEPCSERRKDSLKAAAKKWFPFGFGPKQGTAFVIEDMADNSDDEEMYGDFQHQRIEQEKEMTDGKVWRGSSLFDEYQLVRKTDKAVVLGS